MLSSKDQKICKVCNGKHPAKLHGYIRKKAKPEEQKIDNSDDIKNNNQGVKRTSVKTGTGVISMSEVPVKLQFDIIGNIIKTYALLEGCCQGTFIFENY